VAVRLPTVLMLSVKVSDRCATTSRRPWPWAVTGTVTKTSW